MHSRKGFTLIELLVVIAIIAILAVVVILTLNPAQLLAQSRDANRVSDMATLQSALNLYVTDQASASTFNLGLASDTYPSVYDPAATSTAGDQCGALGLATSTSFTWQCAASSSYRTIASFGWIPVNLSSISAGSPISNLPVDPTNQTSTGLFYAYNTNGSQFQVTADLESQKYKANFGNSPNTNYFPEVISGGTQGISALYNPTGLVGYWPMNEGTGSSTIDASGNGNAGTWNGSSTNGTYYTSGKVGSYAGSFNGGNDYVGINTVTPFQFTGPFTLMAWVNTSVHGSIFSMQNGSNNGYVLAFAYGILRFTIYNGATEYAAGGGSIPTGSWTQVAAVFNGSTMLVYENASLVGQYTGATLTASTGPLVIGAPQRGGDYVAFTGDIDDARIYSRALSVAEIMALYTAEK